ARFTRYTARSGRELTRFLHAGRFPSPTAWEGHAHDTCTPTIRVDSPRLARGRRHPRGHAPLLRARRFGAARRIGDPGRPALAVAPARDRPPHPPLGRRHGPAAAPVEHC